MRPIPIGGEVAGYGGSLQDGLEMLPHEGASVFHTEQGRTPFVAHAVTEVSLEECDGFHGTKVLVGA
eukprot:10399808-Heterocapsa_arctica.AAC.1